MDQPWGVLQPFMGPLVLNYIIKVANTPINDKTSYLQHGDRRASNLSTQRLSGWIITFPSGWHEIYLGANMKLFFRNLQSLFNGLQEYAGTK